MIRKTKIRRKIWKGCTNKRAFSTLEYAQTFANHLNNRDQVPYLCENCGEYHLTTVKPEQSENGK